MLTTNLSVNRHYRLLCSCALILAVLLVFDTSTVFSRGLPPHPVQKLRELELLIHQKRAEGVDVSEAVKLKKKSREVFLAGDTPGCIRLLEKAIALLKGNPQVPAKPAQLRNELPGDLKPVHLEKKPVILEVGTPNVLITHVVPPYNSGQSINDFSAAFPGKKIAAENGKVKLEVSSHPIIVEEVDNTTPGNYSVKKDYQNSPFAIHGIEGHYKENMAYLNDLDVKWVRYAGISGVIWDLVEPVKGKFNWKRNDNLYLSTYKNGVNMLVNIITANKWDQSIKRGRPTIKLPVHVAEYKRFLRKVVERYDGDGIDDAPGSPVINYWQLGNEIENRRAWSDSIENYCRLLNISYEVIKQANPAAKLVLAGFANPRGYDIFYRALFEQLVKKYPGKKLFDVVDFHWSGQFKGTYKKQRLQGVTYNLSKFVETVQEKLKQMGYGNVPIWITEMSDYDDSPLADPIDGEFPPHTEQMQAASLFKMYVYAIAHGVKKAFWVTIKEWHDWGGRGRVNNYFDTVGLVNNPQNDGLSHKKLAFFTYKLMVKKLDGVTLTQTKPLQLGKDIEAYKFLRNGKPIYVLWLDK
jgi:hypothetical protein